MTSLALLKKKWSEAGHNFTIIVTSFSLDSVIKYAHSWAVNESTMAISLFPWSHLDLCELTFKQQCYLTGVDRLNANHTHKFHNIKQFMMWKDHNIWWGYLGCWHSQRAICRLPSWIWVFTSQTFLISFNYMDRQRQPPYSSWLEFDCSWLTNSKTRSESRLCFCTEHPLCCDLAVGRGQQHFL